MYRWAEDEDYRVQRYHFPVRFESEKFIETKSAAGICGVLRQIIRKNFAKSTPYFRNGFKKWYPPH